MTQLPTNIWTYTDVSDGLCKSISQASKMFEPYQIVNYVPYGTKF